MLSLDSGWVEDDLITGNLVLIDMLGVDGLDIMNEFNKTQR